MESKRLVTIVLATALCITAFCQEKWDAKKGMYTNHTDNFHWNLPEQQAFEWKKVQSNEVHTVFKAISPFGIAVIVNVNGDGDGELPNVDMWKHFDRFVALEELTSKRVKERTGMEREMLHAEKTRFAGEKCIKYIVREMKVDDVQVSECISTRYTFIKSNAVWSVSVKCIPEIFEEIGEDGVRAIFAGFGLNATPLQDELNNRKQKEL